MLPTAIICTKAHVDSCILMTKNMVTAHLIDSHIYLMKDVMDGPGDNPPVVVVADVSCHGEGFACASLRSCNKQGQGQRIGVRHLGQHWEAVLSHSLQPMPCCAALCKLAYIPSCQALPGHKQRRIQKSQTAHSPQPQKQLCYTESPGKRGIQI